MHPPEDALETVVLRNDFYRDSYRRVVGGLLIALLVNALLVTVLIYHVLNPPSPRYFATRADGSIMPLVPLDQPNLSQEAVLQWANQAAVAAYTFDFVNYRRELQRASSYFTNRGWQQFLDRLSTSGNLNTVLDRNLLVSAVATGAPQITQEGVVDNRYAWKVEMPILITFSSSDTRIAQSALLILLVVRVPTLNNPQGIGIEQFVMVEGNDNTGLSGLGKR